jgi:hypothetical protein
MTSKLLKLSKQLRQGLRCQLPAGASGDNVIEILFLVTDSGEE